MSPLRRQTRGATSGGAKAKVVPVQSLSKDTNEAHKTRSGRPKDSTKSLSPAKPNRSVKASPSKITPLSKRSTSSPRKSQSPRTPVKNERKPRTSKKTSSGKNVSLPKTRPAAATVKTQKKAPSRTASRPLGSHGNEGSPTQQRLTRRSLPGKSPSSVALKVPKDSRAKPTKAISEPPTMAVRKRQVPPPSISPQSSKRRKWEGKVLIPVQVSNAGDSQQKNMILDNVKKTIRDGLKSTENTATELRSVTVEKKSEVATPDDGLPKLSGQFLQKKWFALKTRGGLTCLRSAILTSEEVTQEVLLRSTVAAPQNNDANFFSTKLMAQLSSKLPPQPVCQEIIDLTNSKDDRVKPVTDSEKKVGTTPQVLKSEKGALIGTAVQGRNTTNEKTSSKKGGVKMGAGKLDGESNLTKRQEREIALRQLKNLKNL